MKAIFAMSGDPITCGHIDSIMQAVSLFPPPHEFIVGIGINAQKKYSFELEEREDMARRSLAHIPHIRVTRFKGDLIDYATEQCAAAVFRGVRNSSDAEFEQLLQQINDSQQGKDRYIPTFIVPSRQALLHISSSAAKELQKNHGIVHEYVPLYVKQCLEARISGQYIVGVTGEIGVGKSFVTKELARLSKERGITAHNVDLDETGHFILNDATDPLYVELRQQIANEFGVSLKDGRINRKELGDIVFNDPAKLRRINKMMFEPLMLMFRRNDIYDKKGLILFNAALIAEANIGYISNNNVVLVTTDEKTQRERLAARGLSADQIGRRIASQYRAAEKRQHIEEAIAATDNGNVWVVDNSATPAVDLTMQLNAVLDDIVQNDVMHALAKPVKP